MADDETLRSFVATFDADHTRSNDSHGHIPARQTAISCCCGRADCPYLERNCNAIQALERDVHQAARVGKHSGGGDNATSRTMESHRKRDGRIEALQQSKRQSQDPSMLTFSLQALLVRHETYVADAEHERKRMMDTIDGLEVEKRSLEMRNTQIITENRSLLDQLETLNTAVVDSNSHVTSLQATLQATQEEMQRLSQLAMKTERLERQLAEFEREQATWHDSMDVKAESEKTAVRRWKDSERRLASLQDQLEQIEREAREEKERHVDVLGRMERRHAVEKELTSAAGRLKGAAASKAGDGRNTVVSHFVKDILQDNANLQMGIVELRDLLQTSNDEVESLRQLLREEPHGDEEKTGKGEREGRKDLRTELTRASSSELHVHHHYHAPTPKPRQSSATRKPKRRRYGALTPGHSTPPSRSSTPHSSISYTNPTSAMAILDHTAASLPQPVPNRSNRWSSQSAQTFPSLYSSSGPASPQSTNRAASPYNDRVFSEAGNESSRPTTPGTEEPGSPLFQPTHIKQGSRGSFRTRSAPMVQRRGFSPAEARPSLDSILDFSLEPAAPPDPSTGDVSGVPIAEEDELDWEDLNATPKVSAAGKKPAPPPYHAGEVEPRIQDRDIYSNRPLRRAASHESLLSVHGMDIHTLKSRPSQMLTAFGGRSYTAATVVSGQHVHAAPSTAMSKPSFNSKHLLSGMAAEQRLPAGAAKAGLTKKVGGWMFGRWGAAPTTAPHASVIDTAPLTSSPKKPVSVRSGSEASSQDPETTPKQLPARLRKPGINQSGPIPGFGPEVKMQHPPVMKKLDTEALKKILDGHTSD